MEEFEFTEPRPRPPIVTIFGDAGLGKNSLASAMAKNPVIIRAEDGAHRQSKQVKMPKGFPNACRNAKEVFDQLLWLLQNDHPFTDLIFDTASAADALFVADTIEKGGKNGNPASSLATAFGGFGAGYGAVSASHGRVRKAAGLLNERKNMGIYFIVHADLETMKLPDVDDFQRYSLRLTQAKNADSVGHYVNNVDLVAHVRLQSALRGGEEDRKKVVSNGDREIVCHATAASVTKNPFGLVDALDFPEGSNPFADYLDYGDTEKPARRRRARVEPDATEDEQPDGDV